MVLAHGAHSYYAESASTAEWTGDAMARVNISVPDLLYERLDRLRDRVNVSRVCSAALEKELDMLETRPRPSDPDIERLLQRLLSGQERWYQRGREDGRRWAVETATR